ncbi:MAG: RNA polymerase factor sigma-54 [Firmicutes bacterium]|nr:RNA polymerase factor sigma-54 [Bacillota bacterium]
MSGLNLELKQLQKLVMTTELKQALDLLTMPVLELQQFVREQLEINPMLEMDDSPALSKEDELFAAMRGESSGNTSGYTINTEEPFTYEARTENYNNLYEYLLFQLNILPLSQRQKKIGKAILSYIDDNGYLLALPGDIALALGVPKNEIKEVMRWIRRFDPPGVCCKNLQDCLILQLDRDHPRYDQLKIIINEHLDMVAANRVPQIAKQLKLPADVVSDLVDIIRGLNPRPGQSYGDQGVVEYVSPDVTVRKIDGEWQVLLNEWDVPKILVSDYYQNLLKSGAEIDSSAEDYLKEKFSAALWVLKAIEQRRKTISDTVTAILKFQSVFFEEGGEYPVPLNLKDIAEEIGVHESTVSRAVSNKYIQTPRGLFSFKYFFPKGVSGTSDTNTLEIKKQLKNLIDHEDPAHPLKDGELTELLNQQGFDISRRTVAKYREQLGILVAGKRKRY